MMTKDEVIQLVNYWMNHYDRKSPSDMELLYMEVEKFARWLVRKEREDLEKELLKLKQGTEIGRAHV